MSSEPGMTGQGITDITPKTNQNPVSFDTAFQAVQTYDPGNKTSVYYILGEGINSDGRAKHWIFGIKRGQEQSFAIYTSMGLSFMPWNGKENYTEIQVGNIVKPADLIKNHRVVLQEVQNPDIDEMELVNGVYTLSSTSAGEGKSVRFNAYNGNAVP
ncbi:MAG TPA: hypothetical protein VMS89_08930 [Methanoregulaceae archaeon]|nr:hypothetical protein [Methanoregulaceae archaeon]